MFLVITHMSCNPQERHCRDPYAKPQLESLHDRGSRKVARITRQSILRLYQSGTAMVITCSTIDDPMPTLYTPRTGFSVPMVRHAASPRQIPKADVFALVRPGIRR